MSRFFTAERMEEICDATLTEAQRAGEIKELRERLARAELAADCAVADLRAIGATCNQAEDEYPRKAIERRLKELENALHEALELAREGWDYASPYFRTKWRADERHAELEAIAGES